MFFRWKAPTLQDHEDRITALELILDARSFDQANAERGPRPINDVLAKALVGYAKSAGLRMPG